MEDSAGAGSTIERVLFKSCVSGAAGHSYDVNSVKCHDDNSAINKQVLGTRLRNNAISPV